jgi:8-oxo-dGTP diphosphatase
VTSSKIVKRQITVFVGLVVKDNRILMVERNEPEAKGAHLKWEVPGGKVDFDELPEEAVVREIEEETGVRARVKRMIPDIFVQYWDYPWGIQQTLLFAYECELLSEGKRKKDHHVKDVKWVELSNVKKLQRLPGVDFFIKKLGS